MAIRSLRLRRKLRRKLKRRLRLTLRAMPRVVQRVHYAGRQRRMRARITALSVVNNLCVVVLAARAREMMVRCRHQHLRATSAWSAVRGSQTSIV